MTRPSGSRDTSAAAVLDRLDRLAVELVAATNSAIGEVGAGELSFLQWRTLVVLGGADGPLRLHEIAERVGASMPSASRLVERMHRRGLVSSERDPGDGRARLITLTEQGELVRSRVVARRRSIIEAGIRGVPTSVGLADELDRILEGLLRPK